jgi:hypothetical protein
LPDVSACSALSGVSSGVNTLRAGEDDFEDV